MTFPMGRDSYDVQIHHSSILAFTEKHTPHLSVIPGYSGLYDTQSGIVECVIRSAGSGFKASYALSRIFRSDGPRRFPERMVGRVKYDVRKRPNQELTIGVATDVCKAMFGRGDQEGDLCSISFVAAPLESSTKVVDLLEEVSDSLFFDIEYQTNALFALTTNDATRRLRPYAPNVRVTSMKLSSVYHKEALSHYFHAQGVKSLPLVRYLALYQVIEVFFSHYQQRQSLTKMSRLLAQPGFDPTKKSDLSKLLDSCISSRSGQRTSELDLLKTTVSSVTDATNLRDFLDSDKEMADFFAKDRIISHKAITTKGTDDELLASLASRIYDIRCRIVHTGDQSNVDGLPSLTPRSKEVKKLHWDLALVNWLARRVLIDAAEPIA